MFGDGDVKAIQHINNHKPYGPEVEVSKEECGGHVAKQMYTHLTALRNRGATDEDGRAVKLKGNNHLTDQIVQRLTRYWGCGWNSNICFGHLLPLHPTKNPAMNIVHKENIHGVNM